MTGCRQEVWITRIHNDLIHSARAAADHSSIFKENEVSSPLQREEQHLYEEIKRTKDCDLSLRPSGVAWLTSIPFQNKERGGPQPVSPELCPPELSWMVFDAKNSTREPI